MNIFALDLAPTQCAQYHVDRHVVKMRLESCQLLISAMHRLYGLDHSSGISTAYSEKNFADFPRKHIDGSPHPYGKGYINHPCAKWTASSLANFGYLLQLGIELCKEHEYRFGLCCEEQKCYEVLMWVKRQKREIFNLFPRFGLTIFAQAIEERLKVDEPTSFHSAVNAYR